MKTAGYDKKLILKRGCFNSVGLYSSSGNLITEFQAVTDREAEAFANAWASSFSSVIVEWDKDANNTRTPTGN